MAIERGESTIRRIGTHDGPGSLQVHGKAGDFVSLLPLDPEVTGIRTDGLRYPLANETLALGPTRGLSNELLDGWPRSSTARGRLLVIHTSRAAATAGGGPT